MRDEECGVLLHLLVHMSPQTSWCNKAADIVCLTFCRARCSLTMEQTWTAGRACLGTLRARGGSPAAAMAMARASG